MNKIIMISGSSYNSGKDTVANVLKNLYKRKGDRVRVIAFGDWVKDSLKRYYNWDGQKDAAGRRLMQTYATDTVRTADPTYWAEVVARLCKATHNDWDTLIISDLRFPNEYEVMSKFFDYHNIVAVRVDREIISNDVNREHISEHSLDKFYFDYIIENNGTISELTDKIQHLYTAIEGTHV